MTQQQDGQHLDHLEEEIDEVRDRVGPEAGGEDDEPKFIQEGDVSEDQPVDDTIAPPG